MIVSAAPLRPSMVRDVRPLSRVIAAPRLLPSFAAILFLACLGITVAAGSRLMSGDGDPSRHLLLGEYILSTGTLPLTNHFVHTTPDQPFLPHEWLAEVASALSHRALGLAGPVLLHAAVLALSITVVFTHLRSRRVPLLLALLLTLGAIVTAQVHWQIRPHVFSFLGLALFHFVLERFYRRRLSAHRLFWLAPAIAVWANLHGAFALGLVLVFTYVVCDAVRLLAAGAAVRAAARQRLLPLLGLAAACVVATLLNPRGVDLLLSLPHYVGGTLATTLTQEFQPPDFRTVYARLFLALLFTLVALFALSPRRPSLQDVALSIGFTYLALTAGRNIALFALAVTPIVGPLAASVCGLATSRGGCRPILAAPGRWIAHRNAAYTRLDGSAGHLALPLLVLTLLSALALVHRAQGDVPIGIAFDPARQPVRAVFALDRSGAPGELFNQQVWGGYLAYRWWPERRPFIDGELNAHSEQLLRDYLTVAELETGWEDILRKYGVGVVLFDTNSALVRTLARSDRWRVVHSDDLATVLVSTEPTR